MASFTYKQRKITDLIAKEANSSFSGWARAVATVTLTGSQVLTLGTLLQREKSPEGDAPWVLATKAGLVITNEFAIVIADHLGEQVDVTGAGEQKVTVIYIGPVVVKDYTLFEAIDKQWTTTDEDKASIKRLLAAQQVVAEVTIK